VAEEGGRVEPSRGAPERAVGELRAAVGGATRARRSLTRGDSGREKTQRAERAQDSRQRRRARGVAVVWRSSTAWCGGRGSAEVARTKRLRAAPPSLGGVRGGATQGRAARVVWTNRLFTRVLVHAAFSGRAMRPRDSSLCALPLHLRRRGRESSRRWCHK
jgi:hypothetical protein